MERTVAVSKEYSLHDIDHTTPSDNLLLKY